MVHFFMFTLRYVYVQITKTFIEISLNVCSIDTTIFALFCEINKIYFGYEGCLGANCARFVLIFSFDWQFQGLCMIYGFRSQLFLSNMTDKNYIKGFPEKINVFKYYQLQTTWYSFHYLLEIKSQQDLSYHKSADKKFVYRFIKFLSWVSTFLITSADGCRVLLNKYCFEKVRVFFYKKTIHDTKTVWDDMAVLLDFIWSTITCWHPMEKNKQVDNISQS